ncbi:DUF1150 family protein [Oleisolibacter albus]|uniref:DUF1150 family protein n=1 Tax=Oleisolibacter albus TaxID=2171757 RepID=UPI000DF183D1|nr:DUF1150 family protein [Oleisolibacter albus]
MTTASQFLRQLSSQDLAAYGVNDIAYVKAVEMQGEPAFAIHAADGTVLTVLKNRDLAVATVRQHDMEPVSIH